MSLDRFEAEQIYLWECSVVPQVALMREAVADVTKLALLDVLLDRVECLLLRDLNSS